VHVGQRRARPWHLVNWDAAAITILRDTTSVVAGQTASKPAGRGFRERLRAVRAKREGTSDALIEGYPEANDEGQATTNRKRRLKFFLAVFTTL
jgi:hypothetical protein